MKLKNKENGIIHEVSFYKNNAAISFLSLENGYRYFYGSLKDFYNEWEDAPEGKHYYIDNSTDIRDEKGRSHYRKQRQEIGNDFESKKEAEKAVERLKAWKRLKDKGFKFDGWDENHHNLGIIEFSFSDVEKSVYDFSGDLDLLFGGEE